MSEGKTQITLRKPINVMGAQVSVVEMREPTVADQLAADAMKGSDAEKEIAIIANLCDLAPGDIKLMTMRDYKSLQQAYVGFLG